MSEGGSGLIVGGHNDGGEQWRAVRRRVFGGGGVWATFTIMELFRPFVSIESFRTPRIPPDPILPEPESFIEWGGPSAFTFDDSFRDLATSGNSFRVNDDKDTNKTIVYTERGRSTSDKRIENPEDSDQFVIVKRINSISFTGAGGAIVEFQLSNPD